MTDWNERMHSKKTVNTPPLLSVRSCPFYSTFSAAGLDEYESDEE